MHRFEYIKYIFFTNSNRSGVQILQYLIKRQSTNAMKSDLFLIPKNNITLAKLKNTAVLKKINVSNAIQLKAYSTLPNKSTGTTTYFSDPFFHLGMFLFRVHIFINFMSYISNSNKKSQKPQGVLFDLNHVKTDPKWMLLLNNCYDIVSGHFFAICIFIFHKTEVQTVILRCLMGLYLNWLKGYGLKCRKMQIFPFPFLCDFVQKHKFAFFAFLGFVS